MAPLYLTNVCHVDRSTDFTEETSLRKAVPESKISFVSVLWGSCVDAAILLS
jgi:hypothetical protein